MGQVVDINYKHAAHGTSANITYCGHSTVLITSEKGKKIIIDPWLDGNPRCPDALRDPGHIDYIVLTHGHSDHASSAASLAKKHQAKVFAIYELAMLMGKEGVAATQLEGMNKGGGLYMPGSDVIRVTLTNAFHSSSFDASDGNTYYAGEACGVVITLESGRNIYHAGDTSFFSDLSLIGQEFKPDIAFIPIGDRFTMGPRDAARAVEVIKPRVVIPVHYATFPLLSGTVESFRNELVNIDCELLPLEPGEQYSF